MRGTIKNGLKLWWHCLIKWHQGIEVTNGLGTEIFCGSCGYEGRVIPLTKKEFVETYSLLSGYKLTRWKFYCYFCGEKGGDSPVCSKCFNIHMEGTV